MTFKGKSCATYLSYNNIFCRIEYIITAYIRNSMYFVVYLMIFNLRLRASSHATIPPFKGVRTSNLLMKVKI